MLAHVEMRKGKEGPSPELSEQAQPQDIPASQFELRDVKKSNGSCCFSPTYGSQGNRPTEAQACLSCVRNAADDGKMLCPSSCRAM